MMIKNEELIKELIKKDFNIPLNKLEKIDFILTETKSKSIKDWEKVLEYIKWYTDRTIKLEQRDWLTETSFELYYEYLYNFKDIENKDIFPKEDMYYLSEQMKEIRFWEEKKMKEKLLKKVKEEYKKARKFSHWENEEKSQDMIK